LRSVVKPRCAWASARTPIRRYVASGELKASKFGPRTNSPIRIQERNLLRFLDRHVVEPKDAARWPVPQSCGIRIVPVSEGTDGCSSQPSATECWRCGSAELLSGHASCPSCREHLERRAVEIREERKFRQQEGLT
jgi:hypothetical protein